MLFIVNMYGSLRSAFKSDFIPLFSVIYVYIYISITVVNIAQFDLYILRVSGHF